LKEKNLTGSYELLGFFFLYMVYRFVKSTGLHLSS
jgi:hypothetical protein